MDWIVNSNGIFFLYDEEDSAAEVVKKLRKNPFIVSIPRASYIEASEPFEGFYVDLSPCGGPERLINKDSNKPDDPYFSTRRDALHAEHEWLRENLTSESILQKLSDSTSH